jgi:signal transduction histidine kinase
MPTPSAPSRRPGGAVVVAAVACAAITLGGALILPLLAAAEPAEGITAVTPSDAAWWGVVALTLAQASALLRVATSSRIVLAAVALGPLIHALAVPGDTYTLTTVAVSFGVFWAALREPPRRLSALLPLVGLLVAGSQTINDVRSGALLDIATIGAAVLQAIAVVGIPLAIALFIAARRETRSARSNELEALGRERDALIQAAVSRERIAMSRELHDIAAHHMSGIALLASAIYRQVDMDPEAAKRAAQQVRTQSTTVLDDLRRVIGLLREESEASRSVETLAAVRELADLRRSAGTSVEFVLRTGSRELGAGIGPLAQLVAYRMVQEALANSAAHAPGANCVVEIDDRAPDSLSVLVENDGAHAPDPGPGGGFGLVGMRERADLVGADLTYGATAVGGWEVRLTIPRDATIPDQIEEPA